MATAKQVPSTKPDIILEMSYEEAQTLRELIGHKVGGVYTGRRVHIQSIYDALVDSAGIASTGAKDMTGYTNFV